MPFVDQRWLGGMLTNFKTVKTSIKRLKDMKAQQEAGLDSMSKKEQLMFAREMEKLEKDIGGIQDMTALPDAIFVIDVGFHKIAVAEAKKLGIPLIGVVDSNHSPEGIDYVIPGNDDSSKAVTLYARGIADAIIEGRANAVERRGQGRLPKAAATNSSKSKKARPPDRRSASLKKGLCCPFFSNLEPVLAEQLNRTEKQHGCNHRKHGRRTARQDRRADDGMQEGADRGRRQHGKGRRAAARQARQQGRQGRRAHHRRRRGRRASSTATPARCSKSTAKPTSSPRTTASWRWRSAAADLVAKHNPADVAALGALPYSQDGFGPTLEDVRKGLIGKIGENMSFRRFKRFAGRASWPRYLHGTRIGVVVEYEGDDDAAKDVAMHVAAMKPVALSSADVPAELIEKERVGRRRQGRGRPQDGRGRRQAARSRPRSSPSASKAACRST